MANKTLLPKILILILLISAVTKGFSQSQKITFSQTLGWESDAMTFEYKVEIKDASGNITEHTIKENSLTVSLPSGDYEWRVTAYDFLGREASVADWTKFTIKKAIEPKAKTVSDRIATGDSKNLEIPLDMKDIESGAKFSLINAKGKVVASGKQQKGKIVFPKVPDGKYKVRITNPGGRYVDTAFINVMEKTPEQIAAEEAEKARLAEEKRKAEEAKKARLAEEKRKAEEAEKARLAEEKRKAEEAEKARLAEEKRKAEEAEKARLAEEKRKADEAEKARLAEEKRKADEAEKARLAEEKRKAEEAEKARLAEEKRKADEESRLSKEQKKNEEAKKKAEEKLRKAEEKQRIAEEKANAKKQKAEEKAVAKEEKRKAEEAKKARLAEEAEQKRLADEAEKARLAEEKAAAREERKNAPPKDIFIMAGANYLFCFGEPQIFDGKKNIIGGDLKIEYLPLKIGNFKLGFNLESQVFPGVVETSYFKEFLLFVPVEINISAFYPIIKDRILVGTQLGGGALWYMQKIEFQTMKDDYKRDDIQKTYLNFMADAGVSARFIIGKHFALDVLAQFEMWHIDDIFKPNVSLGVAAGLRL